MSKHPIHPLPAGNTLKDLIPQYLKMWHKLSHYPQQETVLRNLFAEHPSNDDFEIVLKKISLLNEYYFTNVMATRSMTMHILSIPDLDQRMKGGDVSIVDEIRNFTVDLFSFASKFCSFHNPEAFPIYDSYVAKVLSYYRKSNPSYTGISADILSSNKSYETDFYPMVNDFRNYFGLNAYSYKQLDRFLWQMGKEYFFEYKLAVIGNYVIKRSGPKDISVYKLLMELDRNGKSAGYKDFHFDIATEKEFDSYLQVLKKCCNYVSRKDGIVGEYYIDIGGTTLRVFKKIYESKENENGRSNDKEAILASVLGETANKEGFDIGKESFQDVCNEIVEKHHGKSWAPIEPADESLRRTSR